MAAVAWDDSAAPGGDLLDLITTTKGPGMEAAFLTKVNMSAEQY